MIDYKEFVPIKGYEGIYSINRNGDVKSHARTARINRHGYWMDRVVSERLIAKSKISKGYIAAQLTIDGKSKTHKLHRLVAETFIPNPYGYKCINHKDENKENNCVDNLEWCSNEYNIKYGSGRDRAIEKFRSSGRKVSAFSRDGIFIKEFRCKVEASEFFGIKYSCIDASCRRQFKSIRKGYSGYFFRYSDEIQGDEVGLGSQIG